MKCEENFELDLAGFHLLIAIRSDYMRLDLDLVIMSTDCVLDASSLLFFDPIFFLKFLCDEAMSLNWIDAICFNSKIGSLNVQISYVNSMCIVSHSLLL